MYHAGCLTYDTFISPFFQAELPDIESSGCGSEKGCLGVPKGCSGDDCTMMVTWTPQLQAPGNAHVQIDMMAKSRSWVALALSDDKVMVRGK